MTKLINYFDSLNKILDKKERKRIINLYNQWIIDQHESIIDGSWVDAKGEYTSDPPHHIRTANNAGASMKPHDLWKVPLTNKQHDEQERFGTYQDIFLEKLPDLHQMFCDEVGLIIHVSQHDK